MLPESFKYCLQPGQVILFSPGENDNVIQVNEGICQVQFSQAVLHQPLEGSQSVAQSIWHPEEFKDSHTSNGKDSILSGLLCHFYLPEPGFQVHCGKEPDSDHRFHHLLHAWKRVRILFGPGVKSPEVDAEPESPIFLPDQDHGITPRRL